MMSKEKALSLSNKILQENFLERFDEYLADKKSRPWVIELDPTTACNLACHGCISANLLNQGGFERERIKDLAKEFKEIGVKAVVLIGGGEPMAHPEFGTIVDYFHENDIHVGVTSNGTLIDKYYNSLVNHTKWVRISVDAGSEEVFQKYRPHISGKSQFKKVIDGMYKLCKNKKGKVGYSYLILEKQDKDGKHLESNAPDILNAAKIAKDMGCDYFEVKPSFDLFHYLNDTQNVASVVREQLEKCQDLIDENFKIISPYTLDRTLDGEKKQIKEYSRCLTAEMRTVLSPSGAYVCPYHRGNKNLQIGDPNTQSLKEIWYGKTRQQIMKELDPRKHCQFHCIRHSTNQLLEDISQGKKIDKVEEYDRFI